MRCCDGIYHQPMYVLSLGGLEGLSSAQSTTRETLWQKFAETLSWVAERNSSHEFFEETPVARHQLSQMVVDNTCYNLPVDKKAYPPVRTA